MQAVANRFTSGVIRKRIEYCRNFVFKRNFPIHRIFERGCEIGLWSMTANKIAEVFGQRITKKLKGKLNTVCLLYTSAFFARGEEDFHHLLNPRLVQSAGYLRRL